MCSSIGNNILDFGCSCGETKLCVIWYFVISYPYIRYFLRFFFSIPPTIPICCLSSYSTLTLTHKAMNRIFLLKQLNSLRWKSVHKYKSEINDLLRRMSNTKIGINEKRETRRAAQNEGKVNVRKLANSTNG